MKRTPLVLTAVLSILPGVHAQDKKITFVDDVLPILENKCNSCHNADEAKGGLNLATFAATLTGGSGGEVVISEDPNSSRLFTLAAHTEEPIMPPKGTAATEAELKIISDWIAGGLLETKDSKARKSDKPKVDLNSISATGKPEGPPAMPEHLILEPEVVTERPNAVPALAHSPWAPIVAVAGQKQVLLYHSEDFDLLGVLPYPEGFPQTLSFTPNGAYLICGGGRAGKSGNVVAWDIKTGERIIEAGKEYDIVLGADISPDLKSAILGGPKRNIKMWDTVSGEETANIKKHPDWLLTADYSPDGILFATGGRNGGLYVWEGGTGYEFYTLKGHTAAVTDVDWRADGNLLASCSEDGQVILWEMNEGKEVKKWAAHPGGALAVTFAPNGNLASVGRDKTVKIWKADGSQIRAINASDDVVMSVAFSHDSARVFSGDLLGRIKVWNVESGAELAEIKPNPPTIDEQLAYSEKRIGELTGELPKLEKGVETVSKELTDARNGLTAAQQVAAEATKERDAKKGLVASLDAKIKQVTPQVEAAKQDLAAKQGNSKKHEEALAAARTAVDAAQKALTTASADHASKETALQSAAKALELAKTEAAKPPLASEQQQKHDQLLAALTAAEKAKQGADAAVAAKTNARPALATAFETARKSLADADAKLAAARTAAAGAETAHRNAVAARQKAETDLAAASKDGATPPANLVAARDQAVAAEQAAAASFGNAKNALTQAEAARGTAAGPYTQAEAVIKKIDAELAAIRADQKTKSDTFAAAEAAFKPLRDAMAAGNAQVAKAKTDLAAKTTAHATAEKARNDAKAKLDAANKVLADATTRSKQAETALAAVKAQEKQSADALAAKSNELNAARAALPAEQQALAAAEAKVADAAKKAEAAKASVDAIAKKEADTKKSIELAKAELENTQFLVKKWQAAAINLTAKQEENELDDMEVELEDMKEDEGTKKSEVAVAQQARAEAEMKLAEAKQTVAEGTRKLEEKSTSVLERALQLVASRAVAELKEDAATLQPAADSPETTETTLAAVDTDSDPFADAGMPEEEKETAEQIGAVAAEALAYKSREEIDREVGELRKRLDEIQGFLENTYTEADKTKSTVVQADRVAKETPKVIAERTQKEQEAARLLAEAEAERKRQETALEEQKKRIEELRKQYLSTLPERN